jgi:LacI family transcriptional regulator
MSLGHRDIAFLAGDSLTPAAPRRIEGYRSAFLQAGLPVNEARVLQVGWDIDAGFHGTMKLLDGVEPARRPTAILCANDRLAIGVVLACYRLGLSVPQDISVMGYDDEFRIAKAMVPALSTMALPLREMGAAAMTSLLRDVDRQQAPDDGGTAAPGGTEPRSGTPAETMVPCRLVVRDSTGQVPAGR